MEKEKVYKQSPIAVACYVIAAALLIYAFYTGGNTVSQIKEYYGGYGISATPKEYVTYVLQAVIDPLIRAIMVFMGGYILTAVRKLDPKNYVEKKDNMSNASVIEAKVEDVKEDLAEAKEKVADKIDDAKEEIQEEAQEVKEKVAAKKSDAKTKAKNTGKKAKAKAEEVKEEVADKVEEVKTEVEEEVEKASE